MKKVIPTNQLLTWAVCVLCFASVPAFALTSDGAANNSQTSNGERVEIARTALEKWVETRRILSQERKDFEVGRELVQERIELVQREIESLREKIAEAEESITEADKKRGGLLEENEKLKEAAVSVSATLVELESQTKALLKKLPDPIRERVKPLSQRFPEDPKGTKLGLGERFQNVIGVLNEVGKFNREITLTSEVRALPDGTSAEVTALYVGIGQGYYAGNNGEVGGTGKSSAEGWIWTPANEFAAEIFDTISILKNEKVADFVKLPVEIK
ncbi:MAG: DUF3450 family protein [Candidatus Omnitrophica bacterium]|nr:DUF3450 family protein [Candidatus Omnitrophota bacterium]